MGGSSSRSPESSKKALKYSIKKLGIIEGKAYQFDEVPDLFKKLMRQNKKIISIRLLSSPLHRIEDVKKQMYDFISNNADYLMGKKSVPDHEQRHFKERFILKGSLLGLQLLGKTILHNEISEMFQVDIAHHEILIQLQDYSPIIIGLNDNGLEIITGFDSSELINRRQGNTTKQKHEGSFDSSKLQTFLRENSSKKYDLLDWNCQHFARELMYYVRN